MPQENGIADNVARLRLDRRMTQAALAERVGVSRVALGKIERGVVLPRAGTLAGRPPWTFRSGLVTRIGPLRRIRFVPTPR